MSRNYEVLRGIEQETGAVAIESPPGVPLYADDNCVHTSGYKIGSPARAEILKLVHVLFLSSVNAPHHVLFCGVGTDDGSRDVCVSAAAVLASEVANRVCIVDAKPVGLSLQRPLEPAESIFPRSSPVDQDNFVTRQIDRNLWFASAQRLRQGSTPRGSVEQLSLGLADLGKEFRYVLVDAPPLGPSTIAAMLGQVMDGVVLVLEANATRRLVAGSAKKSLEAANVRLLGSVLKNRTFPIPEKLYRRL